MSSCQTAHLRNPLSTSLPSLPEACRKYPRESPLLPEPTHVPSCGTSILLPSSIRAVAQHANNFGRMIGTRLGSSELGPRTRRAITSSIPALSACLLSSHDAARHDPKQRALLSSSRTHDETPTGARQRFTRKSFTSGGAKLLGVCSAPGPPAGDACVARIAPLQQDRALEGQRSRERLDNAATLNRSETAGTGNCSSAAFVNGCSCLPIEAIVVASLARVALPLYWQPLHIARWRSLCPHGNIRLHAAPRRERKNERARVRQRGRTRLSSPTKSRFGTAKDRRRRSATLFLPWAPSNRNPPRAF